MGKQRSKSSNTITKIVRLAIFLAIGIVLNIVESLIPLPIAIPGVRLGLANTMGLIILYYYKKRFINLYGHTHLHSVWYCLLSA